LALILGLTAVSLRMMPLTPVMKSDFPRSCADFLSSFSSFLFVKLLTKGEKMWRLRWSDLRTWSFWWLVAKQQRILLFFWWDESVVYSLINSLWLLVVVLL
jgi:hypothetical protein